MLLSGLTILFVGLKLTGVIGWSWLWVLAPVWGVPAVLITLGILWLVIAVICGFFD